MEPPAIKTVQRCYHTLKPPPFTFYHWSMCPFEDSTINTVEHSLHSTSNCEEYLILFNHNLAHSMYVYKTDSHVDGNFPRQLHFNFSFWFFWWFSNIITILFKSINYKAANLFEQSLNTLCLYIFIFISYVLHEVEIYTNYSNTRLYDKLDGDCRRQRPLSTDPNPKCKS